MKIVHFQRKPVSKRYFSIENYFDVVREEMVKLGYSPKVAISTYISQGLFPRLFNTIEAAFRQEDINHVTGDVHYINFFFKRSRSILTIHDCVFMKHPSPLARAVLKFFWLTLPVKRAGRITCISEATKRELLSFVTIPEEKIEVIPTVVNEASFSFLPKKMDVSCPIILFVGTTPNKNLERAAAALKGLKCQLEIVGPLTQEQKGVLEENQILYNNEVGISNERMVEKYEEADLLLFPSTYEGFGMPIIEAQLTGRPVITSAIAPMDEVAGNGAILVNPFEIQSIRQGINDLLANEQDRMRLVQKGRENAKRFSPERIARLYLDLYHRMLGS